ncbi:hypothetical protein I5535_17855 [Rhodobacteraceae bacterium F11138]|nr:hypothetical protein [Rhodobacteraceae bacterium F11138]
MSKCISRLALGGMLFALAACEMSTQEEYVIAEPEPISVARSYTGKF